MKSVNKIILALVSLLLSCRAGKKEPPMFDLLTNTGIHFSNDVKNKPDFNIFTYRNFYNGGGVAIGDINNDGLPDIFFTSNMGGNKLYLNKGNMQFEDISVKAGFNPDKKQWSTGVTMADVNGDGWLDIYVCNAGHMENGVLRKNQLFINNRDGTFTDSAAAYGLADSGYSTQAVFFDYDGDGDLDCFLINNSPIPVTTIDYANKRDIPAADWSVSDSLKGGGDHLFRNDNGHFTEVTRQAGIHGSLISLGLGVSVADYNDDGWPDIYVSNDFFERDYLYINQGNGTFKDELEDCMGHISLASMGADVADINNDGWPEVFTTDMLPYDDERLKTTFSFENIDVYRLKQRSGFYHQFFQNCLQLNNRHGKFIEIGNYAGVSATDWSWGALLFDMDNDGYNDIYVCNGIARDLTNQDFLNFTANTMEQEMLATGNKEKLYGILDEMPSTPLPNKVFRNLGNLRFKEVGSDWGFTHPAFSNGAAYGDLDNDGDLDLVINNENGPAFIYRNNSRQLNHNHYIGVLLHGNRPNTFAIGSKIRLFRDSSVFYREVIPTRGFQSSVDYKQIIGLGQLPAVDSLVITWPNGQTTRYLHPTLDSVYTIRQPSGPTGRQASSPMLRQPSGPTGRQASSPTGRQASGPTGSQQSSPTGRQPTAGKAPGMNRAPNGDSLPVTPDTRSSTGNPKPLLILRPSTFDKHIEHDNPDFDFERNLPQMLSREGPRAAYGDVNGDGLTDVYIGGTIGHPGRLYLQTPDGHFVQHPVPAFDQFPDFEDEAVLFFDANGDGHLDLFVGPGGNCYPPFNRQMQNRLFLGDGKGNFTLDPTAFRSHSDGVNTAVAVAGDFNGDGFTDLFVGGGSIPRDYGVNPSSFIYLNDGHGHFSDIAPDKNPDISHIGMVTSAAWADLDNDHHPTLILSGRWMAPRFFRFTGDHFTEMPSNLDHLFGWWQSLTVADLNGDGLPDLVLGNIGENFYLHPDSLHPVRLWVDDFDRNGIPDKILTRTIDGRDMPVFLLRDMEDQLPSLKKRNLKHADYATRSIQQLLPSAELDSALVKTFNYCPSIIAFNEGHGRFRIQPLPPMVQLSSVNAGLVTDVNGDGYPDLILAGNEFGFLPQFGRLDGSFGHVLLGDGKGHFTWTDQGLSGLDLPGQTRDIVRLQGKDHVYLLFLQNDQYPALYEIRQ